MDRKEQQHSNSAHNSLSHPTMHRIASYCTIATNNSQIYPREHTCATTHLTTWLPNLYQTLTLSPRYTNPPCIKPSMTHTHLSSAHTHIRLYRQQSQLKTLPKQWEESSHTTELSLHWPDSHDSSPNYTKWAASPIAVLCILCTPHNPHICPQRCRPPQKHTELHNKLKTLLKTCTS